MARTSVVRPRLRYWFDTTMTRGTPALIGWLSMICLAIVVPVSALLVWADRRRPTTLHNQVMEIWKNVSWAFKLGGAVGAPVFVALSILLALVGLLFASTLVGLIAAGVNRKILDLRRGTSVIMEDHHTVLLGWSEQIYPVLAELVEANAHKRRGAVAQRRRGAVAILAPMDKVEMEELVRDRVPGARSIRVICRTGSPVDPADIERVNPKGARAVIVLTPGGEDGDADLVKTLLAVTKSPGMQDQPHLVLAAVQDVRNREAARLAAGPGACVLSIDDIAARLVVQTCRQPGLSLVYMELLTYEGNEFYLTEEPELVGRSYAEALMSYATSAVIGLRRADGSLALNPPSDTRILAGDEIIAISQDDGTVILSDRPGTIDTAAVVTPAPRVPQPERTLMLGWNRRAALVITELDQYVAKGSTLDVIAREPEVADTVASVPLYRDALTVGFRTGDVTEPAVLRGPDLGAYDHVIVLSDDADGTMGLRADNRTLVTLLQLRHIATGLGCGLPVVAELSDDRNRALAPISESDDFIVSDKLISLLMTQVSESRHRAALFEDLFRTEGSEIYLKPARDYVLLERELDFYTVVESARLQGQSAIGYRLLSEAARPPGFGIHLNPDKKRTIRFTEGDSVIVMAED
ncbi:NAD-binding lipoprotein [Streptomyces sp. NPDC048442]|uniref:CASTOR/POLLUX-related putative ion channel n=1 Tax=Streptomyces sp. NPDC048442 TaxID=3154823 RepID=UPI00343F4CDC